MDQRLRSLVGLSLVVGAFCLGCQRIDVEPETAAPTASEAAASELAPHEQPLMLEFALDERFKPVHREGKATVMRIDGVPDVELWMVVGRDPITGPMPTREQLIERARAHFEPIHGELDVRATDTGNTLMRFDAAREDGNRTLHTVNWMIVRPGDGAILRADVTLRTPDRWAETPLVVDIAKHVGDRLEVARFEPEG